MVPIVFGLVRVPLVEFHLRQRDGSHQGHRGRVEWDCYQVVQSARDSSRRTDVAGTQGSRRRCGQQFGPEDRKPQSQGSGISKGKWRWRKCTGDCEGRLTLERLRTRTRRNIAHYAMSLTNQTFNHDPLHYHSTKSLSLTVGVSER